MPIKQIWFRNSSFRDVKKLVNGDDKFPNEVIKACVAIDVQAVINKYEVVVDAGNICRALTRINALTSSEWIKKNCPYKMIFSIDDINVLWTEPGAYINAI